MDPPQVLLEVIRSWPILKLDLALPFIAAVLESHGRVNRLHVAIEIIGGAKTKLARAPRMLAHPRFSVAHLVFAVSCKQSAVRNVEQSPT